MHVVVTVPRLDRGFGGPPAVAESLARHLPRLGTCVSVVGVGEAPGATGLPALARFHATPIPRTLQPLHDAVSSADVVHVLGYRDPVGTAACLAAFRRGVPYLLEPKGMHRRRLRSTRIKRVFDATAGRLVLGRAALVIATSQLERGELVADGVPESNVVVRPNGVDADRLLPLPARDAARTKFGVPPDAPLVLTLGRIAAKKGLLLLVEALADLPGVWALVAGPDGGDGTLPNLLAARTRLGLASRLVVEPNGLWDTDKAAALADADVFCLPSATENFANVVAEAACCGVPVVVSDRCGVTEWLDPAASRVVPYNDVPAVRTALAEVLFDPAASAAARAAAPGIIGTLDWQIVVEQQERLYEAVVAKPRAAGRSRR